jgi:hypothetical protein
VGVLTTPARHNARDRDVVIYVQVRQKAKILKYDADVLPVFRKLLRGDAGERRAP